MNLRFTAKYAFVLLFLIGQVGVAQKLVLATIEDDSITADEVLYAFQKNRDKSLPITFDSLNQYLDKYINFKLKVREARVQGLDKNELFKKELRGYLSALKKPYAEGTDLTEALIQEAYERMQWQLKASHILIKLAPDAPPADTIAVYEELQALKTTIKNKQDFWEAAKKFSQDGSAQNGGDLGWFSVFMMVYPFETAAYNTPKNEVSEIVRTEFGYHLIFIEDSIKYQGKVRTSHIFFSAQLHTPDEAESLAKSVYDSLKSGADWNEMTKTFSEDAQTKMKGGGLPFAGLKQLPDEYLQAAYQLNIGEISMPVRTNFGFHIIRLDDVQPVPELNLIKEELKEQVLRSGRNSLSDQALLDKIKKDYQFEENQSLIDDLIQNNDLSRLDPNQVIFWLQDRSYRLSDFLAIYNDKQGNTMKQMEEYMAQNIIAYADSMAPIDYPEYGFLRQEYEEGLMLFEIMQKEVWNKALEDSIGQLRFYQENLENYPSPERIALFEIVIQSNQDTAMLIDSLKSIPEQKRLVALSKPEGSGLKIVKRRVPLSELASFEGFNQKKGHVFTWKGNIAVVDQLLPRGFYQLNEIKGKVIADYQEALDQKFIEQLRQRYQVTKDENALLNLLNEQN